VRVRRAHERDRLLAAETEVFAHYGIDTRSDLLHLRDPAITTRAVTVGDGPPTVLLHGANLTACVWAPLLPHLPGRTLHLVELPGCGLADPFDLAGVDLAAHHTAFVTSVLDALGLDRAPVVGASLGGWFALRAAITRPERIAGLALVSAPALALPGARMPLPMAVFARPAMSRLTARFAPAPSARMARRMLATVGGTDAVRDVPEAMFEAVGAAFALAAPSNVHALPTMGRWRTPFPHVAVSEAELAACPVPVLLLWGDEDRVQPPDAGRRAAALLPAGRIEVLPGGHGLWFEQPGRCGELLGSFLQDVDH
jgi:pimeloyl-ACP methyl ester carboxylesterase